ncbi:MAG: hypothetical protein JWR45_431 [Blastococcus sp.]|jgi:hypothetical protein|nr:hypothetical protein [Blastococcus sp.]
MKRSIALGAAWTASAAAAVGLGFLAVSLVGASASPARPVAATTSATATATASGAPVAPSAKGEFATTGGTVLADCTTGSPVLAGVPAAGWSVDDSNDAGRMEFRGGGQKVEVDVACVGGTPVFSLDASSSSAAPAATSAGDDSSGRGGGGHGSDDGSGDDSSGRSGGGHGSDG